MCDKRIRYKKSNKTYSNLIKLLCFLDPLTVRRIKLQGGEPLLDQKGLLLFLKICRLKGFHCFFPTNGSLLTKDFFCAMVRAGLCELTVSLDSWRAQEHDAIRGIQGLFDHIIHILTYIRKHYPSFKLELNFLALPQNIHSLDKTISLAKTLGINTFNILYPENFGKNFGQIQLTASARQKIKSILLRRQSSRMPIHWNARNIKDDAACLWQPDKIIIFENGDINFCEHFPFKKKYTLDQPLRMILKKPEIKNFFNSDHRHCHLSRPLRPILSN
ncbi:MAG: radical SAM protein [Candidatus Omnitrophica bacterium]|nr:radical SAM protein [Candidatus Omnitrophota bacterium]